MSEQQEQKRVFMTRNEAVQLVAAVMVIAVCVENLPTPLTDHPDRPRTEHMGQKPECSTPDASTRRATAELFDGVVYGDTHIARDSLLITSYADRRTDADKELENINISSADGPAELINTANKYTGLLGVTVHAPKTIRYNAATKSRVISLVDSMLDIPAEHINVGGLKHVSLRMNSKHPDVLASVKPYGKHALDTVYYNIATDPEPQTMQHELEHLIDMRDCGSYNIDNDPVFTKKNPPKTYASKKLRPKTYEALYSAASDEKLLHADRGMRRAVKRRSAQAYCHNLAIIDRVQRNTIAASEYAFDSPSEDKAELAGLLQDPNVAAVATYKSQPVLRYKFITVMARLYAKNPEVLRFYASQIKPPKAFKPKFDCD